MSEHEHDHDDPALIVPEFYIDEEGEHRWRLTAANNVIVAASSQGFASKEIAERNLELTRESDELKEGEV